MSRRYDDEALGKALSRLANDSATVSPDFASRLAQIPASTPQRSAAWPARLIKAFGGWGYAAPQLAGLALAAYLGIASGRAQTDTLSDQEATIMTAHVFGDGEDLEWAP